MPTIHVAAAVLIEGGRVLLTQRKAGTHLEGAWELPGGKVEDGEDPREALRRELREELGIDATAGEILDVTFHRYEDAGKAVLLMFFEATRVAGLARAARARRRRVQVGVRGSPTSIRRAFLPRMSPC